ncbi:MAG: hypothetical protein MR935_04710 [Agathobaculum sp.]|uniref:hypothetical protein n=1 Tax=Agathobaculum sp. TaxID=2048138 RepID=UPI0025B87151|nr:hypothetical protein [Agathobaculum sp.]MCI7125489.1 hypothetical protein [Agathobaculum sp.]MDY3711753.1 hypothetical protein [Agathobaculum sp.]
MFDPAPERSKQDEGNLMEAKLFLNRVKENAHKYNVYSEHRIFMILKCCTFLENLMKDRGRSVWPKNQREPIEDFQDVMQLLIYSICDGNFLFDDAGYFLEEPNTESSKYTWAPSAWEQSVCAYHDFAFAMRRRNYAYMELKALRKHLDEHSKQDLNYQDYGTDTDAGSNTSSINEQLSLQFCSQLSRQLSGKAIGARVLNPTTKKNFTNLLKQIKQDRLLKKVFPIIILGVLSGAISADIANLKAYLKPNKTIFNENNAADMCILFSAIAQSFPLIENDLFDQKSALFDPYALLNSLSFINHLCLTDKDFIALAHLCEDCFDQPRKKTEFLQYKQPVNGVPIGEILHALFVLFDAQGYEVTDAKKPRGWVTAIDTLKNAKIIDETDTKDKPNDAPTTERCTAHYLHMVKEKYSIEHYNFNWEVFWLISGYTPPPLFNWKPNYGGKGLIKKPFELYGICAEHLNDLCEAAIGYFIAEWDHPSLPAALRYDISKVRRTIAELGSKSEKQSAFLEELECEIAKGKVLCSQSQLRQSIANFCLRQYNNICSEKERQLKSFKCYENFLGMAMAEEAIKQLCAEAYNKTFRLLASFNQYIWPITN